MSKKTPYCAEGIIPERSLEIAEAIHDMIYEITKADPPSIYIGVCERYKADRVVRLANIITGIDLEAREGEE